MSAEGKLTMPMPTDHLQERLAAVWLWATDVDKSASPEHDAGLIIAARHVLQLITAAPLGRAGRHDRS